MASCSACMWCCVSSLMKMVTFFAGPLVSIVPPLRLTPGYQERSQPYAEIAEQDARRHVHESHPPRPIPYRLIDLVLEARKGGVSAQDPNYQEQPPVRMGLESLGEQR